MFLHANPVLVAGLTFAGMVVPRRLWSIELFLLEELTHLFAEAIHFLLCVYLEKALSPYLEN